MKIGIIIQAKIDSTRLPGKVLKQLPYGSGTTVLEQVIKRVKRSKKNNEIIVATTKQKKDREIIKIAKKEKVKSFRGSMDNVLERYYEAAKKNNLDIIVRITSDCPCIDFNIIDFFIKKYKEIKVDYISNLSKTYPLGLDMQIFSFKALKKAYKNAKNDYEKEHVVPYIHKNPNLFKIFKIKAPEQFYAPDIRITLDTEEDYALLCVIFDYLYFKNKYFTACDIIDLFKQKPWLKLINKKTARKYNSK